MPRGHVMSDRPCARCNRPLSTINTNPDGLCGYCQKDLGCGKPGSRRLREWIANGRKQDLMVHPPKATRRRKGLRLPCDPTSLDTAHLLALLGACKAEVGRRQGEARKLLAALGES